MRRGGFTLIELLIALTLSVFVMIAIIGVSTSMIRYQFEGIRRGEATGSSLAGLDQMHTEIENASYLQLPTVATPGDALSGCSDWSAIMSGPSTGGPIDGVAANVKSFYYCWDNTTSNTLWRYAKTGAGSCPYAPAPNCGTTSGGRAVVSSVFYHTPTTPTFIFRRSMDATGVEMHFIVGKATPTQNIPIPVSYEFHSKIGMTKSYNNASD